jgi:hypothetical protein
LGQNRYSEAETKQHQRVQNLPLENLCATFRDALLVTRALNHSYLWIDSLCIIQDDPEDWARESALMADVYGNSALNIAATQAKDGNGGLFVNRDGALIPRQFIRMPNQEIHELHDSKLYHRCLTDAPLSQRAWTIQERFLAPSTVHFSAEQIFYECGGLLSCESWPEGLPNNDNPYDPIFPHTIKDMSTGWAQIASLYSRSRLSFSGDKLVAFSGIVRWFRSITGDEYIAGLWRRNLERQLC